MWAPVVGDPALLPCLEVLSPTPELQSYKSRVSIVYYYVLPYSFFFSKNNQASDRKKGQYSPRVSNKMSDYILSTMRIIILIISIHQKEITTCIGN